VSAYNLLLFGGCGVTLIVILICLARPVAFILLNGWKYAWDKFKLGETDLCVSCRRWCSSAELEYYFCRECREEDDA
jgi:hypothetical protein